MAVELATAYVSIVPTTRGITGAIAGQLGAPVKAASAKAGKDAGSIFGDRFKKAAKFGAVGIAALGFAAAKVAKDAVLLEAAFSKTMAQVGVATKAPQAQLKQLDRLALKLGADTVFSANEAADAMLQLAKGGLSPAQIQAGALKNTLTLATAGGLELGAAADSLVRTMGAFQLGAKQTDVAVSALAGAANASSAEVSDITQALAQAGTEAHASGLSVQETTGILAAFTDAGIAGSDAGTSLRTMLTRLVPQTDKAKNAMADLGLKFTNANGQFVGAEQIAQRLQDSFKGMSQAERSTALTTIFGADARRAANVLITEGADGLATYIKQTSDLTQAQKLANAAMSGTEGALKRLEGSAETAQLKIGKALRPTVIDLSDRLAEFLDNAPIQQWTTQFVGGVTTVARELRPLATDLYEIGRDALPVVIQASGLTVTALETLLDVAGPLLDAFDALPDPIQQVAITMGAARLAMPGLTGGLGRVGTAVSDMVLDFRTAPSKMDAVKSRMARLSAGARNLAGPAGMGALLVASQTTNAGMSTLLSAAGGAATGFSVGGPWGAAIGGAAGALLGLATATEGASVAAQEYAKKAAKSAETNERLKSTIDQVTGAYTRQTRVELARALQQSDVAPFINVIGVSYRDLTAAILGNEAAWKRVIAQTNRAVKEGRLNEDFQKDFLNNIRDFAPALQREQKAIRESQNAATSWTKVLKGVPKNVVTELRHQNFAPTFKDINRLNDVYKLTPENLTTIIKETGADLTARQVNDLFRDYDKLPPSIVTFLKQSGADGVLADVRRMRAGVNRELGDIDNEDIQLDIAAQTTSTLAKIAEFAPQMHAAGGRIVGPGSGTSDSVPIYASSGEYIIRESIARRIYPFLEALNAGQTEAFRAAGPGRFASGGRVSIDPHAQTSGALSKIAAYANVVGGWAGGLATDISTVISSVIERLFAFGGNGQPLGIGGSLSWGQIAQGQQFAQSQAGKPYMWTGVGPYGFDCSGFVGAVLNAALGRYPYTRVGSTGTMPWPGSAPGVGRYTIGWFTGDPGHTSGDIGGLGVESAGGVGVQLGSAARSPLDSMFNGLMHYDVGGVLRPGYTLAYNGTGRNEIVARYAEGGKVKGLSDDFIVKVLKDVRDEFGGRGPMVKAIREWLEGLKKSDFSQSALKDEIADFNAQQKKQLSQNVLGRLKDVFGSGSPVVSAIQQWLDGLKKGEFTQRAMNKRLREVVRRNIDPAIRQFRVSGRQTRGETRSEISELLGTLRQVLGRDAPVIKRVDRLGDRLVKVQARQDKTVARYQRANDKLDSIISAQNQFVRDVRAAFTHDAFSESETSAQARLQFRADRNDAQKALRQFRQLASKGLDAGIIKQLARSGNTALIAQLSRMTPKQIKAFERDLKGRNKATAALAEFTGNKVFGRQIRAQRQVVNQLSRSVNEWNRVIEKMERKVERATYEGTRRGIERGFKERDNRARRRRRAGAR